MGIQKDSGELLALIYQNKVSGGESLQIANLEKMTGWNNDRIISALEYLVKKNFIDGRIIKTMGSTKPVFVSINGINPGGIDIVEDKEKFKANFGFEVGLPGFFKFSFGLTEK